jgi:WD40 repeat protein
VLPIVEKGLGGATLRPGHEQVVCIYDGGIGLFDAETGRLLDSFEVPSKGMFDLDVSPDGCYAVTASADELGRIFEFEELEDEGEEEEVDEDLEYEDEDDEEED